MLSKSFRDNAGAKLDDALSEAHRDFTARLSAAFAALWLTGNRFGSSAEGTLERNSIAEVQLRSRIIADICTNALTSATDESAEEVARFADDRLLEEYQKITDLVDAARPRLRGAFQAPLDLSQELRRSREALGAAFVPPNSPVKSKPTGMADPLTSLLHRGVFDSDLQELLQASAQDRPLGLILADIDRFKAVNDTHGHQTGDLVLVEVSRRLQAVVNGKGKVYRYGGEEIVILLPNHSIEEATAVAERARVTLAAQAIANLTITASFGVASSTSDADDGMSIFETVDKALYKAKDNGRDLVRVYGEPDAAEARPRKPSRKLPEPGQLTESQRQDLRRRHFQGENVKCPHDGAILRILDITTHASVGDEIMVTCPLCGLSENLSGD